MEENNQKKSFTVIEILVILVIISSLFLGGIVNYQNFNQQQKLKNEAKKFAEVFDLTKKRAISSQLYNQSCTNFNGYRIFINLSGNQYQVQFGCNNSYLNIQTYDLPTNIVFVIGNNSFFNFPPMGVNININVNNLRIKNLLINQCLNISISNNGIIEMDNQLISC